MDKHNILSWGGCLLSAISTLGQTQQVFQTIQLVLTILVSLVTLAYTIYKWYTKAKKDGNIDKEEIEEAISIVMEGIEEIKEEINEAPKEEEK